MGELFIWTTGKVLLEGVGFTSQGSLPPLLPTPMTETHGMTTISPLHRTYFPFSSPVLNQLAAVVSKW